MCPTSWEEAVKQAKAILEPYCPRAPRIKVFVGFEVRPAAYSECPHVESPEDALDVAENEDDYAALLLKREARSKPLVKG